MKYDMTSPAGNPTTIVTLIGIAVIIIGLLIIFSISLSQDGAIQVVDKNLVIKAFPYSTKISLNDLDIEKMRIIDMNKEKINIGMRTNGIGLPGLHLGWFSGIKGKMKLYLTDRSNVLELPTKKGYIILFSTTNGENIMKDIRTEAAGIEVIEK